MAARIPTYQGPQVQEQALQGGFQDAGAMTAGARNTAALGGSLMRVSDVVDQIDLRDANEQAFKAETQIKSSWLEADQQLRQKYRGGNVEGYKEEVQKWWDGAESNFGSSLSQRARNIAARTLTNAKATATAGAMRYYEGEKERSLVESFQSSKALDAQMAITDGSEGAVAAAASTIAKRNAEFGATRGWSTEQVQAENLKDLSALHIQFIGSIADKNPTAARAYFEKNRGTIESSRQQRIEAVLKGEEENHAAAASARDLVQLPVDQAVAKISQIEDPELMRKTELAYKQLFGLQQLQRAEQEKGFSDKAWQLVSSGQRVPEAILSNMDGRERARLQDYQRQQAEHAVDRAYTLNRRSQILANAEDGGSGGKRSSSIKTKPDVHARLWSLMGDDPEAFKTLPLESYRFDLSTSDLEQLMTKQQKLRQGPKAKDDTEAEVNRQVNGVAAMAKMKGEQKAVLQSAADAAFSDYEATHGKKPGRDERQRILDRLMIEGEVSSGAWWKPDANKAYYQLKPSEKQSFVEGTVPAKDRKDIEAALKARGIPVTPDNVLDMFNRARNR